MAASFAVNLEFKAGGAEQQLRKLQGSTSKLEQAAKRLRDSFGEKLTAALQRAGQVGQVAGQKIKRGLVVAANSADKLAKKVSGLRSQLLGLGVGAALGKAFSDATALESAQTRINNLTKSYSKFEGVQESANRSAKKFRLTQAEALATYADLGSRLGGTGVGLKDLENIYEGFNTLLINNKVEAQQAAAAQLQLGQALGEGVLRAEEYNSLIATTPQLLDEVARVMGVPRGELKKLAGEGKISSQFLIKALSNIRTKGAADLEAAFSGAFGASRDFNKALKEFSTTVGTQLLPVMTPLLTGAAKLLELFGKLPGPVKTTAVAVTALATGFVIAAPAISAAVTALKAIGIVGLIAAGKVVLIAAAVAGVALAIKALYDKWEPFRRATFAVAEFARGVFVSLAQQFEQTSTSWGENAAKFQKFFVDIWNAITGFFDGIGKKLQGIWGAVVDYFNENLPGVAKFFSEVWTGVAKFFAGVINNLKNQWKGFIEFVVNSATGPVGQALKLAGINIGKSVADGIANGVGAFAVGPGIELPKPPKKTTNTSSSLSSLNSLSGGGTGSGSGAGTRGAGGTKAPSGTIIELLTGDKASPFYRADHGGSNYHIHIAFKSPVERKLAEQVLRDGGIQIGSTTGGRHAPGSYHYTGQAIDIPASQVPVGSEDALSRAVISTLDRAGFAGLGMSGDAGNALGQVLADARVEAERLAELGRERLSTSEALVEKLKIQQQISAAITDPERQALEYKLKQLEINQQYDEMLQSQLEGLKGQTAEQVKQNIESARALELATARNEAIKQAGYNMGAGLADMLPKANEELTKTEELLKGSFDIVANGLTNSIRGLIDGTKEWNDVLSDVLGQLGQMFLQAGFSALGGALKIPGFADGGRPKVGQVSLVGERGPELFVPDQAGTVLSNANSKAAMSRWNASNAQSAGAMTAEASGEGGGAALLNPVINVTAGPTLNFEGSNFVSRADFDAGLVHAAQQGAKQGEALALRRLQMSAATRRRLGL